MMEAMRKLLLRKRQAYRLTFLVDGNPSIQAKIVLADLAKFCRATSPTTIVSLISGEVDPLASAQADGRREVWLRISQNLNISDADLYRIISQESDATHEIGEASQ